MNKTACGTRLKSKRGVTLVELVVGITIIVVVFGATLSALTNGYSTTIKNADKNKAAAVCASVNDVLTQRVKNLNIEDYKSSAGEDATKLTTQSTQNQDLLEKAAQETYQQIMFDPTAGTQIKYVAKASYPSEDDVQFTYDFGASSSVKKGATATTAVHGATVKTAIAFSDGYVYNESFVPYKKLR